MHRFTLLLVAWSIRLNKIARDVATAALRVIFPVGERERGREGGREGVYGCRVLIITRYLELIGRRERESERERERERERE